MKHFLIVLFIASLFSACSPNKTFEKVVNIPGHEWIYKDKAVYEVKINDTTAYYDLSLVVRHTADYGFTNLWVNIHTIYPSGKRGERKEQIKLGSNEEQKWLGECMGDICDREVTVINGLQLSEKGLYKFEIEHVMRTNPLPGVVGIGLRLEK